MTAPAQPAQSTAPSAPLPDRPIQQGPKSNPASPAAEAGLKDRSVARERPIADSSRGRSSGTIQTAYTEPASSTAKRGSQRLQIPADLPRSEAAAITLPPWTRETPEAQRRSAIKRLYEELPALPTPAAPEPPPAGTPLTLEDLQQIAVERSPLIRQAAADVEAARGAAIQAGAYYNPHLAYQADTINTALSAGYQGAGLSQTVVTGGKLQLARAAACVDVENAEFALRKVHYDLATQVRSNYFAVLVAGERVKINRALTGFADGVYRTQIARVTGGEAAPYEPLQLRVLAVQARTQLIQAENDHQAAWRRLAATVNAPDMPLTELAGRIDARVPQIGYDGAVHQILSNHTNLAIARNAVTKARYQLRLAKITPLAPDIDTATVVQKDNTTPPFGTTVNIQAGIPLPVFNTNRGNIIAAEAGLVRAQHEYDRARNELLSSLADVFSRYQTSTATSQYYRSQILLD
jgi:cobalt-zinc-cadmium efflux system outer membrane protein